MNTHTMYLLALRIKWRRVLKRISLLMALLLASPTMAQTNSTPIPDIPSRVEATEGPTDVAPTSGTSSPIIEPEQVPAGAGEVPGQAADEGGQVPAGAGEKQVPAGAGEVPGQAADVWEQVLSGDEAKPGQSGDEAKPGQVKEATPGSVGSGQTELRVGNGAKTIGNAKDAGTAKPGRGLLVVSSGAWGGYALGTLGYLGQRQEIGIPLGIGAGVILGAGSAYLMTLDDDISLRDAQYILGAQFWGGAAGWIATAAYSDVIQNSSEEHPVLRTRAALGPVGMGAGLLFAALSPRDDFASLHLSGVGGILGTIGISLLWSPDRPEEAVGAAALSTGLSLVHLGAGTLLGRKSKFSQNDAYLMMHLTAHTAQAGALIPYLFAPNPDPEQHWGGALTFSSIGLLGSRLLAQRTELTPAQVNGLSLDAVLGESFGAGLLMTLGSLNNVERAPQGVLHTASASLAGEALGMTLGAALHERYKEQPVTLGYQALGTLIGAYQAAGIGYSLYDHGVISDKQYLGLTMSTAAVGGLAGLAFNPRQGPSKPSTPWILASTTTWGAWYGAWAGVMLDKSGADILMMSTLGSDLGLGTGFLLAAPNLEMSPTRIGYTSLCGLAGAALADLVTLMSSDDAQFLGGANLVGATAGLATGALTSRLIPAKVSIRAGNRSASGLKANGPEKISRWHPIFSVGPLVAPGNPAGPANGQAEKPAPPPWGFHLSLTQPVPG